MDTSLPGGLVTFLFTDIEHSTQSLALLGDERYAELQEVHHSLLREAFLNHGGIEVATIGDAFFVVFERPSEAVVAAVEAQRALDGYPWPSGASLRVRMGMHTGEALVRTDDYVGHEVHRAKRICDAGHGGQILLSGETAALVADDLAGGVTLRELGPHRLKDLGEPQRIYQVRADGLASEFPRLRSLDSFRHNLPVQLSSFVGRDGEIIDVRKLVENHRLVTLTGVGGCGKTRLAVQVGAEMLDANPDGVFFVDLASLSDPDLVARTIATAVGAPSEPPMGLSSGMAGGDVLLEFLSQRTCLLLLDNCEHLLDACAGLAAAIVGRCPDVTILATSREPLDVDGEQAWRVPSLELPDEPNQARAAEAVRLFEARASAVRPDFELNEHNIAAVTDICRRLDGIPLAIEFAASRTSHLSPSEISSRLGEMFRLLTGGRRRVQRQQTLQATLDWSYELLSDDERTLLRRLAVFTSSFLLEPAEAVCTNGDIAPYDVLDLLGSLVAKSLVSADGRGAAMRYRLLEPVRQYASHKLLQAGESELYRSRLRDWYLTWACAVPWEQVFLDDVLTPPGPAAPRAPLDLAAEHPNLRTALEWSAAEGRPDLVVKLASRLWSLWSRSHYEEGHRWLSVAAPEELDLTVEERVAALSTLALCSYLQRPDVGPLLSLTERAVDAASDQLVGPVVTALGWRAIIRSIEAGVSRHRALADNCRREIDDGLQIASQLARPWTAIYRVYAGTALIMLGDYEAAADTLRIAMSVLGDEPGSFFAPAAAMFLSACEHLVGEHVAAVALANRSGELAPLAGGEGMAATCRAMALAGAGRIPEAHDVLLDAVGEARRSGLPAVLEGLIIGFAGVAFLGGDALRAATLFAWVRVRAFEEGRLIRSPADYAFYIRYMAQTRRAIGAQEARRALEHARSMSESEVIALATQPPANGS